MTDDAFLGVPRPLYGGDDEAALQLSHVKDEGLEANTTHASRKEVVIACAQQGIYITGCLSFLNLSVYHWRLQKERTNKHSQNSDYVHPFSQLPSNTTYVCTSC